MAGPNVNCSCAWGDPSVDADGNCTCPTGDVPPGTGGIKSPKGMKWTPRGWRPRNPAYNYPPTVKPPVTPATTATDDGKIFGFPPLVVLGAAAAGVWILSAMDGKK